MKSKDKAIIEAIVVIKGLMDIAQVAMPDTYWQSDRQVNAARKWLAEHDR
jgi:hypothetical protein